MEIFDIPLYPLEKWSRNRQEGFWFGLKEEKKKKMRHNPFSLCYYSKELGKILIPYFHPILNYTLRMPIIHFRKGEFEILRARFILLLIGSIKIEGWEKEFSTEFYQNHLG